MVCDVCSRSFSTRRKPLCPSCAQTILYTPRVSQVQALSERENAHNHAEAIVRPGNDGVLAALPQDVDLDAITTGMQRHSLERSQAEHHIIESRIQSVTDKARELREEIEAYRIYMSEKEGIHKRRRQDFVIGRQRIAECKSYTIENVCSDARRLEKKLQRVHAKTAQARATLCREVALLSGLTRRIGGDRAWEYSLGGAQIFDLRQLNGNPVNDMTETTQLDKLAFNPKQYEIINASLGNICHLIVHCCHYLYVRLPAEIVLPHNDCPAAMIFPERASYRTRDADDPTLHPHHSTSPAVSTLLDRSTTSRPRPLSIERSLPQLAKEDSKSFNMFIEGMALLAWDIAWLCKTQGIEPMGDFADISAVGRNLCSLFLPGDHGGRPALYRNLSTATSHAKSSTDAPSLQLGVYSHGSAQHSLSGPDVAHVLRNWKYASPTRLADRLKNHLTNELSHREWDEINAGEWDDEPEDERAVLVGGTRRSLDKTGPAMSVMTVAPADDMDDGRSTVPKAKEGWMRVRNRGGEL